MKNNYLFIGLLEIFEYLDISIITNYQLLQPWADHPLDEIT
jgi:hypothetical protein